MQLIIIFIILNVAESLYIEDICVKAATVHICIKYHPNVVQDCIGRIKPKYNTVSINLNL
jgi:hypothetical protein